MPTPRVLVAGGVNMDTTYRVARLPSPGETVNAVARSRAIGGKGLNQALAVRRAGSSVGILGSVGDDADGKAIREFLAEEGVSCESLAVLPDADTGRAIILVDDDAENLIVVDLGANLLTDVSAVESLGGSFSGVRAVAANGEAPQRVVRALFEKARKLSIATVWNPSPMPDDVSALIRLTDTLIVNRAEAMHLAGRDAPPIELGRALARKGPSEVVVTLGAEGSQVCTRRESVRIPAAGAEPVDPTAAGDTFLGYYLTSRLDALEPDAAALVGSAAAALCVQSVGASDAIPRREDLPDDL